MKNIDFYNSPSYRRKQSIFAKANWKKGIYDFRLKREKRRCLNPKCKKLFKVESVDTKKFCSCKCAAQVNNPKRSKIPLGTEEKLRKLYQKGLSMQEISDKIGWKYGKVVYWLRKFNIPRRSMSEATYVKRNPNGDPFKIRSGFNKNEILLKVLGLGLYWGEGDKSNNNTAVRMSNTDPRLLKKFKEFLENICGVKKEKFGYYLTLFNDCDKKEAIKFWEEHLGIKKEQLGKIIRIPPQGKGTYSKKSKFGVLNITVTNKKLKEKILEMINEL